MKKVLQNESFNLALVVIAWLLSFYPMFNGFVLDTGSIAVYDFSNYLWGRFTFDVLIVSLTILVLIPILAAQDDFKSIFWTLFFNFVKFFFFIVEISIGIYVANILFGVQFTGFNPILILVLNGFIAYLLTEIVRKRILAIIKGKLAF